MRLFSQLVGDIQEWGRQTFGPAKDHVPGLLAHLAEEAFELEIAASEENRAEELADVFILLCGLAEAFEVDLEVAVERKMAINRAREWAKPDADGVIRHIEG